MPSPLVWFAALFPVLIVVLFFVTLNFNYKVLYARSDFPHPEDFVAILQGDYGKPEITGDELREFWKPNGVIAPPKAYRSRYRALRTRLC